VNDRCVVVNMVGTPGELVYIVMTGTVKVFAPQPDGTDCDRGDPGPGRPRWAN